MSSANGLESTQSDGWERAAADYRLHATPAGIIPEQWRALVEERDELLRRLRASHGSMHYGLFDTEYPEEDVVAERCIAAFEKAADAVNMKNQFYPAARWEVRELLGGESQVVPVKAGGVM